MRSRLSTRPSSLRAAAMRGVLIALGTAVVAGTPAIALAQPAGYAALLDITPVNANAEQSGGLDPRLPTDVAALDAALGEARTAGVPARRYSALLHQYWLTRGAQAAGIDLAAWDPNTGLAANATLVDRVYENYGRYQLDRAELYWAGMAGMAGASFTGGFWDIEMGRTALGIDAVRGLGGAVAAATRGLPEAAAALLPSDARALATVGPTVTAQDLDWYQKRLLIMQKHIFFDMVPMHEAYVAGGRAAVDELDAAGLLDDNAAAAWEGIYSGTPAGYADAMVRMADREQNQVVADQWDVTSAAGGGVGRALTYMTTIAAKPSVPGSTAPGVFAPMSVTGDVDGATYRLRAPLPDFNWADRGPRWTYIAGDIAVAYQRLAEDRPGEARALLSLPFRQFADRQRALHRAPDLLRDLSAGWSLERQP
ncbi:hypothetical protein [Rhodococcus sp. NPDC058514]|uniref:hypothetical protein n=1 Tax=unclassified Rhodococcus (in: high G+C Gram-positive bacteria) TaxID=192944 RepID=UPI0036553D40